MYNIRKQETKEICEYKTRYDNVNTCSVFDDLFVNALVVT